MLVCFHPAFPPQKSPQPAVERRTLTISTIKLADRVTLGVYGVMLPDTEAETGAVLDNCSVLLKGERAMAGTRWRGIPAEPVY